MKVLLIFASVEGHTRKIANFIHAQLKEMGHSADEVDAGKQDCIYPSNKYDKVILAASIHRRRHPVNFEKFISRHLQEIDAKDNLMISVSLCAAFPEGQDEAQTYLHEFTRRTGFKASLNALVGGALQFEKYKDYESLVIRLIGLHINRYESVDRDQEFTNWSLLESTVSELMQM